MATALRNSQVSEAEREARQQLAACYRVFAMLGWDEMIYNHITLKVPDEDGAFLINPFGLHFSEVTASNLVKIDIDGNKLDDNPYPVNLAGFTQHALFHRHRILTQVSGDHLEVIKLIPPLTIGEREVETFVEAFTQVMDDVHRDNSVLWGFGKSLISAARGR